MTYEYIWGTENCIYEGNDILIKKIDAHEKLSVQVHPGDDYAAAHGLGNGKTECWYITACDERAFIYCGVKDPGISRAIFAAAVADGTVENYLKKIYVSPGDFIFIPAGTVHAIGAGISLIEVQQNSRTTYRLYDYKRKDSEGKERELHIEQGLECFDPDPRCGIFELPFECRYFRIEKNGSCLRVTSGGEGLEIPVN